VLSLHSHVSSEVLTFDAAKTLMYELRIISAIIFTVLESSHRSVRFHFEIPVTCREAELVVHVLGIKELCLRIQLILRN
jgi:uncharacterized membrane protein